MHYVAIRVSNSSSMILVLCDDVEGTVGYCVKILILICIELHIKKDDRVYHLFDGRSSINSFY